MKPSEALDSAIGKALLVGRLSHYQAPGSLIASLPAEKREALKDLKSEDIRDIRLPK